MSRSLTNFYETQEIRCRLGLAQRIVVFRFPNINHSWTLDDAMLFDEIQTFFRENVVALLKFSLLLKNSKQNILSFSLSIHCYYLLNSAKFQLQTRGRTWQDGLRSLITRRRFALSRASFKSRAHSSKKLSFFFSLLQQSAIGALFFPTWTFKISNHFKIVAFWASKLFDNGVQVQRLKRH